ncbi:MAG: hypothetical protein LBR32_04670 [Propionibacteriaceae bacterium]|jgi:plasmid stability protein|nr:hypothetical protein [Propionibacteriaceae bacterium]
MAGTITIRNLDEETQRVLKHRAVDHGISFEAEIRRLLREAARDGEPAKPTGAQLVLSASQQFRQATADLGDWDFERVVEGPRRRLY